MKNYQENEEGSLVRGGITIPKTETNRHYREALRQVEAGEAEILPYIETVVGSNTLIDNEIKDLEFTQTYRRIREAILTPSGKAWLQDVEDQIKTLRNQKV